MRRVDSLGRACSVEPSQALVPEPLNHPSSVLRGDTQYKAGKEQLRTWCCKAAKSGTKVRTRTSTRVKGGMVFTTTLQTTQFTRVLERDLAEPRPKDSRTTRELSRYRQLDRRWHDWSAVTVACQELASEMLAFVTDRISAGGEDGA